jgi:hypothetical protein
MPPVDSITQVILGFHERSFCYPYVPSKLGMSIATEAFGQIARRRCTRVFDLIAEFAIISCRGRINKCVHLLFQFVRELPGPELIKSSDNHASS